jgi:uncharacterized membrane protein (UPF0127 family)
VPWLLRDGEVLAAIELAESRQERWRGLRGRNGFEGALLLRPARSVNTVGMQFPVDVAYCSSDLVVVDMVTMPRFRLGRPRRRASCVIEARAGAFERWGLRPGDQLEIR